MDTNKLHGQYRIMIKPVVILFEVEIGITVCTINKWCGKYSCFINIKRFVINVVLYNTSMPNISGGQNITSMVMFLKQN